MVEVGFLMDAGAVAFTDCDRVVTDPKVFSRALTYARSLGALVMAHPQEPGLSQGAAVTSSKFASLRGLPAVSPMAERMGLERDIALVEMTGARYHADNLSASVALPVLERAKAAGLNLWALLALLVAAAMGAAGSKQHIGFGVRCHRNDPRIQYDVGVTLY